MTPPPPPEKIKITQQTHPTTAKKTPQTKHITNKNKKKSPKRCTFYALEDVAF